VVVEKSPIDLNWNDFIGLYALGIDWDFGIRLWVFLGFGFFLCALGIGH
jgi:hypothetical protein